MSLRKSCDRVEDRAEGLQAPEAVDDRGHRGEQVDEVGGRPRTATSGAYCVMNRATATPTGTAMSMRDRRDGDGRPEQLEDAEPQVRRVVDRPLARGEEVDLVVGDRRDGLPEQERPDQRHEADDEDARRPWPRRRRAGRRAGRCRRRRRSGCVGRRVRAARQRSKRRLRSSRCASRCVRSRWVRVVVGRCGRSCGRAACSHRNGYAGELATSQPPGIPGGSGQCGDGRVDLGADLVGERRVADLLEALLGVGRGEVRQEGLGEGRLARRPCPSSRRSRRSPGGSGRRRPPWSRSRA